MKHTTLFCTIMMITAFYCSADIQEPISSDKENYPVEDIEHDETEHDETVPVVTIDKLDLFEQETLIEGHARQLINLILNVLTEPSSENKEALNAYVTHHLTRLTTVYDVSLNLTITPRASYPIHRLDSSLAHETTRSNHKELMQDTEKIEKTEKQEECTIKPTENPVIKERQKVADNLLDVARSLGEIITQPDCPPQQLASNLVDVFLNLFRMGASIMLADS